ncbi:MAG: OB-fold nucleic acid binding domain-containing protein, partial [Jatrophihabitantaceae bacterium]
AFSNGIFVLTLMSMLLLLVGRANVDKLIPFYALGVFTGFTLAGFGMAKYHTLHKQPGWKYKWWINATGGGLSLAVVIITAVVKFNEGAWLVLVVAPIMWFTLMRLNQRYRDEARALRLVTNALGKGAALPNYPRHIILVMVDRLDLAVVRALRYAGSLHPTDLRAVHISLDGERTAELERSWIERGLGDRVPLEVIECPDRRLIRAVAETALNAVIGERAEVTVLLPRRTFKRVSQRILHDRTADRIAGAMAKLPHVSATIVPFDTTLNEAQEQELERQRAKARQVGSPSGETASADGPRPVTAEAEAPIEPDEHGVLPIAAVKWKQRVTIEGRIKIVQVGTTAGKSLEAQVFDSTGGMRLLFFGRTRIPGIEPGSRVRVTGTVGEYKGHLALANPRYELLPADTKTR